MKAITSIICLLSLIISVHGLKTRVFGGTNALEGRYPYHVYLRAAVRIHPEGVDYAYCSGSIINNRWILTAAHCFKDLDFRSIQVKVGSVSINSGTVYSVERRIVHENFDDTWLVNDIALLRVSRDIVFNDKVQPIPLADHNTIICNNENVVFTGYGRMEDNNSADTLKAVDLKMYTFAKCKKAERSIKEMQICTLPKGRKSPCVGDSGGPLVNANGIQVGVYSHAYGDLPKKCAKVPHIYTRVALFRAWINAKIR